MTTPAQKSSKFCPKTIPPDTPLLYIARKQISQVIRVKQSRYRPNNTKSDVKAGTVRVLHLLLTVFMLSLTVPANTQEQTEETAKSDQVPTETPKSQESKEAEKPALTEDEQRAARALEARLKARKEQEDALAKIEASIAVSKERHSELEAEIKELQADRQTVQTDLIDTAGRIKQLESDLSESEERLKTLFADQTALRVSLAEQRDSLSEILAALQRIGRNPPPALVIRPNEALNAVRSAILLSTLVPEIRIEAQSLAAQLDELIRLHTKIEQEKGALQTGLIRLQEERKRLDLLIAKKKDQETATQQAALGEEKKTSELALRARSLQELIDGMEQEIEAAKLAVEEAREAERQNLEEKLKTKKQKIAALKDAARLSPAIPFDKMRGLLRFPARGAMLKSFGSGDGFGGQTKGLSIATRAGAQVTSPSDGWIVYAGPFRSFGKLLIINAGDGYHVVLAGMDELFAEVGSFVLANEPIGLMKNARLASTDLLDSSASRPVLYIELRKDGDAIDPSPWWTADFKEKADG